MSLGLTCSNCLQPIKGEAISAVIGINKESKTDVKFVPSVVGLYCSYNHLIIDLYLYIQNED